MRARGGRRRGCDDVDGWGTNCSNMFEYLTGLLEGEAGPSSLTALLMAG